MDRIKLAVRLSGIEASHEIGARVYSLGACVHSNGREMKLTWSRNGMMSSPYASEFLGVIDDWALVC